MQKYPLEPIGNCKVLYYPKIKMYTTCRMPYEDYLQTDVWKEIRRQIWERDGHKCTICGTGENITVHHHRYPAMAWGTEKPETLITVCDKCHAEIHKEDIRGGK